MKMKGMTEIINKAMALLATTRHREPPRAIHCPDKLEPTPRDTYCHYRGDRWDQALSRLFRNGLV